jgi:hypothetical protein
MELETLHQKFQLVLGQLLFNQFQPMEVFQLIKQFVMEVTQLLFQVMEQDLVMEL